MGVVEHCFGWNAANIQARSSKRATVFNTSGLNPKRKVNPSPYEMEMSLP